MRTMGRGVNRNPINIFNALPHLLKKQTTGAHFQNNLAFRQKELNSVRTMSQNKSPTKEGVSCT
jgi:hypothetical protein